MNNQEAIAVGRRYQQAHQEMAQLVRGWCAGAGLDGWRMDPQIVFGSDGMGLTLVSPTEHDWITVSLIRDGRAIAMYWRRNDKPWLQARGADAAGVIRQVVAARYLLARGDEEGQ